MMKNRYDRRIRYIDYLVNGERQQGGGFVKLEERGGQCYFTMRIGGLRLAGSLLCPIYFIGYSGEEMVGEVSLRSGQGSWECSQPNPEHLFRTGIAYDDIRAIRVAVAAGRELYCRVREQEEMPEERTVSAVSSDTDIVMQAASLIEERIQSRTDVEDSQERISIAEEEREPTKTGLSQNREQTSTGAEEIRLWEEKWRQLTAIYPHRNPFQDEREYLTLGPSDFVVLSEDSYRLVSNSFLLHGYYNYQHLILTRQPKRGELRYYIGVPGNYYEREKQVAVMFGFESFECKSEPAREGDFGYYMIPVSL